MGKKSVLLAAALAVAGLCILLWPVVSGHRLQADMNAAAQSFLEEARQPYPELLADLQGYNQRIYTERQAGLADALACEEPAVLLRDCGVEDEIIGVLEIPTLELVMPVYLGASGAHLDAGAAVPLSISTSLTVTLIAAAASEGTAVMVLVALVVVAV